MKSKKTFMVFAIMAFAAFFGVSQQRAYAAMPTLSLTPSTTSGYTQMSVNGDANSAVYLYYALQGAGTQTATTGSLGTTNSFGYLSININDTLYNIPYGAAVYVNVDGQNSASVPWPSPSTGSVTTGLPGSTGGLSLNQTNITLTVGQTTAVTAYNYNSTYYPISILSNSNSYSVSATVIGSQINLTGVNYGSATIIICQTSTNVCGTVYATVPSPVTSLPQPSYPTYPYTTYPTYPTYSQPISYTSPVSFNSTNEMLDANTTQNVQIYGSGNYYIYQNSNPVVVSATLTGGNWLTLTGIEAGTSNIIVCENYGSNSCATLPVDIISNQQYGYPYQYSYPYSSYYNNNSYYPW